jgi:hypothetical protein
MSEGTAAPKRRGAGGRPSGTPASEAQKRAGKQNIRKAHTARKERKKARQAKPPEKPRWKKLVDGDIGINDLTLEELVKGQVANNDGSWEGRRHDLGPRMKQKMYTAFRRRFRTDFDNLAPLALDAFEEILQDDENPAQRWAAAKTMIEYQMGKVPDVVHVGPETEYDRLQQTAFVIRRGADLAHELEAHQEPGDGTDDAEVVEAELVEEEA